MDALPTKARVKLGFKQEDRCFNYCNEELKFGLEESTENEDCIEKTDCWKTSKSGKKFRVAIKTRLDKDGKLAKNRKDILVALFDPYYGVGDPRTKVGRDMLYEYGMYLSAISGQLRNANGKVIHNICSDLYKEFLERVKNYIPLERGSKPKHLMDSFIHDGCQIWLHYDAFDHHPKLLGFVSPDILVPKKEIIVYPYFDE